MSWEQGSFAAEEPPQDPPPLPEVQSHALLAGCREVLIRHGDSIYRLKLTSNNKLILMK